jgi:hypothetical protein
LDQAPQSIKFEYLSGPNLRSAIDAAFIDAYADLGGVGYATLADTVEAVISDFTQNKTKIAGLSLNLVQVVNDPDKDSKAVVRLFDRFMSTGVAKVKAVVVEPSDDFVALSNEAATLLSDIDQELYEQIVFNGRYVGYIDYSETTARVGYREIAQSVSSHLIPSTFFVSYHSARNSETLAEAFLHESLHKKLSNTLYVNDFFLDVEYSGRFFSYWNRDASWNSNKWECDRAIYAFHFYAHFGMFYSDSNVKNALKISGNDKAATAIERGKALFEWMRDTWPAYLTPAGWKYFSDLSERARYT